MHVQTYGRSFSISHLTKRNASPRTLIFPRNSFTVINSLENANFLSPPANSRAKMKCNRDSAEALKIFMSSSEYKDMWTSKFEPIIQMVLPINFSVDPVGTELV